MATVSFRYRSIKDYGSLTLRLEHSKKQYHTTTKILVERDFKDYYRKTVRSQELRAKQDKLEKQIKPIEKFVLEAFYKLDDESMLSNDWLKKVYANYLNPVNISKESQNITYWLDYKIDNHKKFKNSKGGYGLSPDRLKGLRNIKELILIYEGESLNRKLRLSDMTQEGFDLLKDFLFDLEYKPTSIHKTLSDIKMTGRVARKQRMKLPDNFDIIEIERGNFLEVDEDVIYLTENELERIISLDLKQDYLINARKWLLLGAYTGQRIDDQFNKFIQDNFIETKSGIEIHLTQSKTGAKVKIPVHPHIKDILNPENMPRVISRQKLNDYMKKICELAEINELINDQKRGFVKEVTLLGKKRKIYRKIKKERPKYDYIASHTGRRTFCMMWYKNKKLSNNEIMAVTGHETEKSFLTYINKSNDDHIKAFTDEYDKINL